MMSYEFWTEQVLRVMALIADREYQVTRWLAPDTKGWEHPGALIVDIFDAFNFDLFVEMYSSGWSEAQSSACKRFSQYANHWCDSTPTWPGTRETIDSPDWVRVREAAAEFIRAFGPLHEHPA